MRIRIGHAWRLSGLSTAAGIILATTPRCSSPSTPPAGSPAGSVNGSVSGRSLDVGDGVAAVDPGSAVPHVFVVLGNRNALCPLLQGATGSEAAGNQIASFTSLDFQLYDQRSNMVAPGTLPVPPPDAGTSGKLEADVVFTALDATCSMQTYTWATSGTVTLTSLQPTVVGSYDLMFGADHVTGTFNVSYCDGVHVQGTGGMTPAVCEK